MPLNVGNKDATEGMANAVYLAVDRELTRLMAELLAENNVPPEDIDKAIAELDKRPWVRLSFAIADGVVRYFLRDDPPEDAPITLPEYAETYSSTDDDPDFWSWLVDFVGVFKKWAEDETGNPATLHDDLEAHFADPGKAVPTELKGIIK